jgi:FtsP/CotA-like multicopper oxidase with cupredoxin domain
MDHQREPLVMPSGRDRVRSRRRTSLDRRNLLRLTAAAGFGIAGVGSMGLFLPRSGAGRARAQGEALIEPEVRSSQDGLLDTTLEATVMPVPVAGGTAIMSAYEGSVPGPTLRVRPGDRLRVQLINKLDALPDGLPDDSPFLCVERTGPGHTPGTEHVTSCDTNLHMHGFHVSPSDNSDNIFVRVAAGESFQYEYQIPDNHASGVFVYHPHMHGNSAAQMFSGLGGAIIVEGDIDQIPGIAGVTERVLVLQATQLVEDGSSVLAQQDGRQSQYLRLVNGQLNPTMTIQPGETQRWRICNLTTSTTYRLHLEGHQLHQIAKDGNALAETWTRDEVFLSPGERAEVLIQGGPAGTYLLKTLPIATGFTTQAEAVLATVVSEGASQSPQPLPTTLLPFEDLSTAEIDEYRRITFQVRPPIGPRNSSFEINSHIFDPERDDQIVRLNATDEWVLRNASTVWHPFHIHVNDYQVVAVNGHPVPVRSREDTTGVPPFGEITIRTRYLDFPGRWVFHCHILLHEDAGMMGTVRCDP